MAGKMMPYCHSRGQKILNDDIFKWNDNIMKVSLKKKKQL